MTQSPAQPAFQAGLFFANGVTTLNALRNQYSTMSYNPQDRYFKQAKKEGYRSRASYKLLELQRRYRILHPGSSVVDLGAAPGGWLQVAAKIVGPEGKIVGVDLQDIEPLHQSGIALVRGDVTDAAIQEKIIQLLDAPADCVISDMAPKLSGIRDADIARCLELNRAALAVAIQLLRRGGVLLIKSFISSELHVFTAELKQHFAAVQRTKAEATRQGSSEFYFLAKGFDGNNRPA